MGDLRPNGDGAGPDDGGYYRGGLPDLPPEWGLVVIPDDVSELDQDAEVVRRELRREARQAKLRQVLGIGPQTEQASATTLTLPVVIMALTVLVTLVSFLVVLWQHHAIAPAPVATLTNPPASAAAAGRSGTPASVSDIVLPGPDGRPVRLESLLPAVVLLVDHCDCATLVAQIAADAPVGVAVVPISRIAADLPALVNVRPLVDSAGTQYARLAGISGTTALAPPTTAAAAPITAAALPTAGAILVNRSGAVVSSSPAVGSASVLGDLALLVR